MPPTGSREATADSRRSSQHAAERYDWRRPSKFGREHVRALANAHDVFSRRMSTSLGSMLRGLVQVEPLGIDQMTYDDYARSLPNPNVNALLRLPPLAGDAVLEMNVGLALQMVDRMLGGRGLPVELRRPTDLELPLIGDICAVTVRCLSEALEPLLSARPELGLIETNPQLIQATSPSDMVLLLSYRLTIAQGEPTEGMLTLCYPAATLAPVLDRLTRSVGPGHDVDTSDAAAAEASARVATHLGEIDVPVAVQLTDCGVRAGDLLSLGVGDVLRLDHRLGEPAVVKIGGAAVLRGHIGRRGRRLGLQVTEVVAPTADLAGAAVRTAQDLRHDDFR